MNGKRFSPFSPESVVLTGLSSVNTFSNVPVSGVSVSTRRALSIAVGSFRGMGRMGSGSPTWCAVERHG